MTMEISTNFLYFLISEGNDLLLKEEIKTKYKDLRLSYSRPGFITYKSPTPLGDLDTKLDIIFAYSYGLSLVKSTTATLLETVDKVIKTNLSNSKIILNTYLCHEVQQDLLSHLKDKIISRPYQSTDIVLEIRKTLFNEYFIGARTYGKCRTIINDYTIDDSPSRAYYKAKDALDWTGITVKAGETALNIGCSPGGVSFYLLKHGLKVVGVDPRESHEDCMKNTNYKHILLTIEELQKKDLAAFNFDWIFIDINLDPQYVLYELERVFCYLSKEIKGLFFTAKMTQKFAQKHIPAFLTRFKTLGFKEVYAIQLPSNRSEFQVFATKKQK